MTTSFDLLSDIHLEFNPAFKITKSNSKNLILAGDICELTNYKKYIRFLESCKERYTNVFIVYGNHEFYNTKGSKKGTASLKNTFEEKVKDIPGIYVLDNKCIYLYPTDKEDLVYTTPPLHANNDSVVKIIGSTLFSEINEKAAKYMNDYKYIYSSDNTLLTRQDSLDLFKTNKEFILKELDCSYKCLLITHHAANTQCELRKTELSSAFATDIHELYKFKNLKVAVFGHTHDSFDKVVVGIRFISNQVGYPGEDTGLKNCKTFKV